MRGIPSPCLSGLYLQFPISCPPTPLQTLMGIPELKEGLFQSTESKPQNDDITATSQANSVSLVPNLIRSLVYVALYVFKDKASLEPGPQKASYKAFMWKIAMEWLKKKKNTGRKIRQKQNEIDVINLNHKPVDKFILHHDGFASCSETEFKARMVVHSKSPS